MAHRESISTTACGELKFLVGQCGRFLILICAIIGVLCSIVTITSCEFLSFQSWNTDVEAGNNSGGNEYNNVIIRPVDGMDPPFYSTTAATIGLFNYQILESTDPADISDECVTFKYRFFALNDVNTNVEDINSETDNSNDESSSASSPSSSSTTNTATSNTVVTVTTTNDYYYTLITTASKSWIVAQICSMISVVLGGCCVVMTLMEMCFGNSKISFGINMFICLLACSIQGCTFLIWKNSSICNYDETLQTCELGGGGYASIIACSLYFFCGFLLCCFPRPNPCVGTICCPLLDEHFDEFRVDNVYSDDVDSHTNGGSAGPGDSTTNTRTMGTSSRSSEEGGSNRHGGGGGIAGGSISLGGGPGSKGSRSTDSPSPTSSDEAEPSLGNGVGAGGRIGATPSYLPSGYRK